MLFIYKIIWTKDDRFVKFLPKNQQKWEFSHSKLLLPEAKFNLESESTIKNCIIYIQNQFICSWQIFQNFLIFGQKINKNENSRTQNYFYREPNSIWNPNQQQKIVLFIYKINSLARDRFFEIFWFLVKKSTKMSILDLETTFTGSQIQFGIRINHKKLYYFYTKSFELKMTDSWNSCPKINKNDNSFTQKYFYQKPNSI